MKPVSKLLGLAEDRVLVEQLRLLMMSTLDTGIPITAVVIFLVWSLTNSNNALILGAWAVVALLSHLNFYYFCRRCLSRGIAPDQTHKLVWTLGGFSAAGGVIWGALAWVAIDRTNLSGSLLVLVATAAMASGAASSRSPVMPVFVAYVIPNMVLAALKMWQTGRSDLAYISLGWACIFYMFGLLGQGRSNAKTIRSSIDLRFENLDLLDKLHQETALAKAAHLVAEQANTAKSKFLAAASHDLRQPIHAQGLFLDVLRRTQLDAQQRQLMDSVCAAGAASSEMLNTLLDFSRIEAGVIEPHLSAFRVQSVLNKIEGEFAQQADDKGLRYRSRESALVVQSDTGLIEMILRNLVSNAIRYSDRGGLLVVCRKRDDHAVLEVWDTGIGISPEHQDEVFREFHQVGNPQRDRRNGLGLGLAITRSLAQALGHSLTLASTLHKGSVFRVTLPLATHAHAAEVLAPSLSQVQALRLRVLVIEDDESAQRAMLTLLRDWGCECIGVSDIEEALAQVPGLRPQVIVSDYRLREGCTGVQAIAVVRQAMGAELPALLTTGDTAPDRLREAMASGIALFHKPISPVNLHHELARVQRLIQLTPN